MRLLAATAGVHRREAPARAPDTPAACVLRLPIWSGAILLAVVVILALRCGKAPIPFDMQARILARRLLGLGPVSWPASYETILLSIRLPRIVLGALVGSALAVAGAGYQGLFRNPLADPYLMGVASGAGLGAGLAFVLPFPAAFYGMGIIQLLAFLGALGTVCAVYLLARVGRAVPTTTLILSGVAIGALANAVTAYLMVTHGDRLPGIYTWLLGGFNVANWTQAALTAPGILVSIVLIRLHGRVLNVLQLGEEQAAGLGIDAERAKRLLIGAATLATASAVSVSGLIGFVGLIVPHAGRMVFGPDHRRLVPASALLGAAFLVGADAVARSVPGGGEMPVGVVTAACGAPFFLLLVRSQKREVF